MDKKELNAFYKNLYNKAQELMRPFISMHRNYKCEMGFYNGHYSKDENGNYQMEFFPIPVIRIKGYCDIEIGIDSISISTKLSKQDIEFFDYTLLEKYDFEAYGVENYLDDYYLKGSTIDEFIQKVKESNEKEIGFSFVFDDLDEEKVYRFVGFLSQNKFYY